jgi:hypothetical protein
LSRGITAAEKEEAMTLRLCRLCWGACNLLAIDRGKMHYYVCPHCKGLGCTP